MNQGKDRRPYIRLAAEVMTHPKIIGLSNAAFTAWLHLLTYSARHMTDGVVPRAVWRRTARPAVRDALIAVQLIHHTNDMKMSCVCCKNDPPDDLGSAVFIHDFLRHQSSRDEVQATRDGRQRGSAAANHRRWHEGRGVVQPDCPHCAGQGPPPPTSPSDGVSQERSQGRWGRGSLEGSHIGNPLELELEVELEPGHPPRAPYVCQRARDTNTRSEKQPSANRPGGDHPPASRTDPANTRALPAAPADHGDSERPSRTDPPRADDARAVLAAWASTCHRPPPAAVLTQLHRQVDQLLTEGFTHHELAQCLTVWSHKGLHPKTLPSVVHEVLNSGNGYANVTDANIALLLSAALPTGPVDAPRAALDPGEREP